MPKMPAECYRKRVAHQRIAESAIRLLLVATFLFYGNALNAQEGNSISNIANQSEKASALSDFSFDLAFEQILRDPDGNTIHHDIRSISASFLQTGEYRFNIVADESEESVLDREYFFNGEVLKAAFNKSWVELYPNDSAASDIVSLANPFTYAYTDPEKFKALAFTATYEGTVTLDGQELLLIQFKKTRADGIRLAGGLPEPKDSEHLFISEFYAEPQAPHPVRLIRSYEVLGENRMLTGETQIDTVSLENGHVMPSRVVARGYAPVKPGEMSVYLRDETSLVYSNYIINNDLTPEDLDIVVAPGTRILDTISNTEYTTMSLLSDDTLRGLRDEIRRVELVESLNIDADRSDVSVDASPEPESSRLANSDRSSSYVIPALVVLGIFAVAIVLVSVKLRK